eukprot:166899_1
MDYVCESCTAPVKKSRKSRKDSEYILCAICRRIQNIQNYTSKISEAKTFLLNNPTHLVNSAENIEERISLRMREMREEQWSSHCARCNTKLLVNHRCKWENECFCTICYMHFYSLAEKTKVREFWDVVKIRNISVQDDYNNETDIVFTNLEKVRCGAENIITDLLTKFAFWLFQGRDVKIVPKKWKRGKVVYDIHFEMLDCNDSFPFQWDERLHDALFGNTFHFKNGQYSSDHESSGNFILTEMQYKPTHDKNCHEIRFGDTCIDGELSSLQITNILKIMYLYVDIIINNKISRDKIPNVLYVYYNVAVIPKIQNGNKLLNKLHSSFKYIKAQPMMHQTFIQEYYQHLHDIEEEDYDTGQKIAYLVPLMKNFTQRRNIECKLEIDDPKISFGMIFTSNESPKKSYNPRVKQYNHYTSECTQYTTGISEKFLHELDMEWFENRYISSQLKTPKWITRSSIIAKCAYYSSVYSSATLVYGYVRQILMSELPGFECVPFQCNLIYLLYKFYDEFTLSYSLSHKQTLHWVYDIFKSQFEPLLADNRVTCKVSIISFDWYGNTTDLLKNEPVGKFAKFEWDIKHNQFYGQFWKRIETSPNFLLNYLKKTLKQKYYTNVSIIIKLNKDDSNKDGKILEYECNSIYCVYNSCNILLNEKLMQNIQQNKVSVQDLIKCAYYGRPVGITYQQMNQYAQTVTLKQDYDVKVDCVFNYDFIRKKKTRRKKRFSTDQLLKSLGYQSWDAYEDALFNTNDDD